MPPTAGVRLIYDFLLPHLDGQTFGNHLQWVSRERGEFRIFMLHQGRGEWNENNHDVFKAWSVMKKLWDCNDSKRTTKAKHRLQAALRKHKKSIFLHKKDNYLFYKLVDLDLNGKPPNETSSCETDIESSAENNSILYVTNKREITESETQNGVPEAKLVVSESEYYPSAYSATNVLDDELLPSKGQLLEEVGKDQQEPPNLSQSVEFREQNDDLVHVWGTIPGCLSNTRCCDVLPDSKSSHSQLCIWNNQT